MWNVAGLGAQVKALLDRLTSTRAGYLDRLDATVSSRASASDWPASLASQIDTNLDAPISAISPVKSVQRGTFSMGSGTGSHTQNISTIASSKAFVLHTVKSSNAGITSMSLMVRLYSTYITFQRGNPNYSVDVAWEVIEFN